MAPNLPLPKYHRIYLVLREQLHEGRFAKGVPAETTLMRQFGVARVTVRRALGQLAEEGLIERSPGRGTRPTHRSGRAGPDGEPMRTELTGLLENLVSMGLQTTVQVLEAGEVSASDEVAQALQMPVGAAVNKAIRVRSTQSGPLSHITTWVPSAIAGRIDREALQRKPILLLLEEAGVHVGRAQQNISARLADAEVAGHLDIAVGSALLAVRRLIFDDQDRPVQWLHGLYRPDRYEYEMQLSRVGGIAARVWVSKDMSAHFH